MSAIDDLSTVRDHLRHAVSRFRAAKLEFGHGATSAIDEAAFIVLEGLSLPIEDINPWLDARLTRPERERLLGLIEARVSTRKPAAYLLNRAYLRGLPFYVDERVIVPRSFIADILFSELIGGGGEMPPLIAEPDGVTRVLDLCTGSGCLAVLAARVFPNATVDAVELSPDALAVAERNVSEHGLTDRVTLFRGDLFAPVAGRRYDLILANPPYVSRAEVEAFPAEYAAEPTMAHLGGEDGLDLVRRIIAEAPAHLGRGGGLICEVGLGRAILQEEFGEDDFVWLDTEASEGEVFWMGNDR